MGQMGKFVGYGMDVSMFFIIIETKKSWKVHQIWN